MCLGFRFRIGAKLGPIGICRNRITHEKYHLRCGGGPEECFILTVSRKHSGS